MKARNVDKANNIYDEKKIPTTTKLFSVKCQYKCFIEKKCHHFYAIVVDWYLPKLLLIHLINDLKFNVYFN